MLRNDPLEQWDRDHFIHPSTHLAQFARGEAPQRIVPADHWQAAETTGAFTLVSCTVSPEFSFEGFELAPRGFDIPG